MRASLLGTTVVEYFSPHGSPDTPDRQVQDAPPDILCQRVVELNPGGSTRWGIVCSEDHWWAFKHEDDDI